MESGAAGESIHSFYFPLSQCAIVFEERRDFRSVSLNWVNVRWVEFISATLRFRIFPQFFYFLFLPLWAIETTRVWKGFDKNKNMSMLVSSSAHMRSEYNLFISGGYGIRKNVSLFEFGIHGYGCEKCWWAAITKHIHTNPCIQFIMSLDTTFLL